MKPLLLTFLLLFIESSAFAEVGEIPKDGTCIGIIKLKGKSKPIKFNLELPKNIHTRAREVAPIDPPTFEKTFKTDFGISEVFITSLWSEEKRIGTQSIYVISKYTGEVDNQIFPLYGSRTGMKKIELDVSIDHPIREKNGIRPLFTISCVPSE